MPSLTLVVIVLLTSVGAFLVATRGVRLRRAALPGAVISALDCLGLAVLFLLGNLGLGLVLVLGLRAVTGQFLSVYVLSDATLAVLSLLQALVLHCWQARSK